MNKYSSPASPNQYGSFNLALPSPTMSIIPMIKTNVAVSYTHLTLPTNACV